MAFVEHRGGDLGEIDDSLARLPRVYGGTDGLAETGAKRGGRGDVAVRFRLSVGSGAIALERGASTDDRLVPPGSAMRGAEHAHVLRQAREAGPVLRDRLGRRFDQHV